MGLRLGIVLLLLAAGIAFGLLFMWSEGPPAPASIDVATVLGGEPDPRYARVTSPRELRFPDDHGEHPEYQIEWWYFTGNLDGSSNQRFGFELTFFRIALAPLSESEPARRSAWAASQLYMAHAALTDVEGNHRLSTRHRKGQCRCPLGEVSRCVRVTPAQLSLVVSSPAGNRPIVEQCTCGEMTPCFDGDGRSAKRDGLRRRVAVCERAIAQLPVVVSSPTDD